MITTSAPPPRDHHRGRRRLALLVAVLVAGTTATAVTMTATETRAAERTVAYLCDGQPTNLAFSEVTVPTGASGMGGGAGFTVSYQAALPPLPAGSTVASVALDTPPPRLSSPLWTTRNITPRVSGGNLKPYSLLDGAQLRFDGPQPAGAAELPVVRLDLVIMAHGDFVTGGTVETLLPDMTVTTDAGTIRCTPGPDQILGTTRVQILLGTTPSRPPSSPVTTPPTSSTTTTTTPLCRPPAGVPAWYWQLVRFLFRIPC
jgi:hypothetical protein